MSASADDLEEQWNKRVFGSDIAKRLRVFVAEPVAQEAAAEIERLRGIAFDAEMCAQKVRKTTIEECARVAEKLAAYGFEHGQRRDIAAAIRALKDRI